MSGFGQVLLAIFLIGRVCLGQVKSADARCEACHKTIYQQYLTTPMANASGAAAEHLLTGQLVHKRSGVRYAISQDADGAKFSFEDTRDGRIRGTRPLAYFLGSGRLGVTYLYRQEGYLMETPIAWYSASGGYDMKPGFGDLTQMPDAIPMEATCLRCHMSGVQAPQSGTPNRYVGLPFEQTGITCESCHGDTSAHVRSEGKAAVVNPGKLDAETRDAVCISCHLEGDVTVKRAGRSVLQYRPGQRISDYLSYFVIASNDPLRRGVSEVEQFSVSGCKRASGDRMSCMSCHDPHRSPAPAEKVVFYRTKCLTCHAEPMFTRTHHPEQADCTTCHMPKGTAQDIPHVAWTDHQILRNPVQPATTGVRGEQETALTPIFSPQANERDAAMAKYLLLMSGRSQDRAEVLEVLRRAYANGAHDTAMLEALGVLNALNGHAAESEARLRTLLSEEPMNLTALSDLGLFLAREGHLEAAITSLKDAFSRNEDDIQLARTLAVVQCAADATAAAQKTMGRALTFSPGRRQAWDFKCPSDDSVSQTR